MKNNAISIHSLYKNYDDHEIINNLNIEIEPNEFVVILGPSGCGKSTLLNMLAGLEKVTQGIIKFGEKQVQDSPPKDRGCALVFQNYALYPHMTIADNIGYALKVAGVPKKEREQRILKTAQMVDLEKHLPKKPSQLSGGQRQRVAIARAIIREPNVLLFDEPLSNLDAKLRHDMRMELRQLHKNIKATSIFVTHDQVEAMTLADRVIILNQGNVEQFGTPKQIYHHPETTFVASFIGAPPMNLISVKGNGEYLHLADGTPLIKHTNTEETLFGIRGEHIHIESEDTGLRCEIQYREDLGSHQSLVLELPTGEKINMVTTQTDQVENKDHISISFDHNNIHLFNPKTKKRIN